MEDGLAALAAIRELNGNELHGKALVVSEAPRDSGTVAFPVPPATPAEPGALASLLARGGPSDGTTITLSDGTTTLGRALESDLVVEEPGVSREHASIRREAGAYWIRDLDSRNGTFVNGVSIGATPHRLQDSDRIELGGANTPVHWVFVQQ